MIDELTDLVIDILAHTENDWAITLGGNEANCHSAAVVAHEIARILKLGDLNKLIRRRAKKLRRMYGA